MGSDGGENGQTVHELSVGSSGEALQCSVPILNGDQSGGFGGRTGRETGLEAGWAGEVASR